MSNFIKKKWSDVCTLEYGKGLRDYKNEDNDYAVYGSAGIIGTHSQYHQDEGVIVSRKGTLDVYYSDKPFFVIDTAFFLKTKPILNSKWAYYALKHYNIKKLASGTSVPSLSRDDFYETDLLLPALHYQSQVESILSRIDKKIELNQEMNETLEEIAKTLFKSWFIDFDPVRAKAEGRPTGLSEEISDLFPDSFEDSELGEIPKGWKASKIKDFCSRIQKGISPKYTENKSYCVINQKCIRNLEINFDLCRFSEYKKIMEDRFLENFDILLNSMGVGTLGRSTLFIKHHTKAVVDGCISVIRGKDKSHGLYVYQSISRRENEIINLSRGSTGQTTLKTEDIGNLLLVKPKNQVIDLFYKTVSDFHIKKYTNIQENKVLSNIRDALLPKLISGELKIPDAQELIDKVNP